MEKKSSFLKHQELDFLAKLNSNLADSPSVPTLIATSAPYQQPQQQYQQPQQQYQPPYQAPNPPQTQSVTKHVHAPIDRPFNNNGGLPAGQNICADCERLIV